MALEEQVKTWQEIAASKRAIRDTAVSARLREQHDGPRSSGGEVDPTRIVDVAELLQLFVEGAISVQSVVRAYINRACKAQEQTNCLTETCFDEAIEDAKRLDEHYGSTGQLIGPLHGVPMSLKDQFNVKGYDSTIGYVGRAFDPADDDALIVKTLRALGAVVIAKTNIPQSIMWCETENPLWGLTTHPINPHLTPGGSSGGEGVLLSLQGSLIGWGTDIGGSIRIPSHMNGLWGLKPSSGRFSYHGVPVSVEGQQHVPSTIGPLARSCDSLITVTRAVIKAEPWVDDPQCVPLPWRTDVLETFSQQRLTIGLLLDDGVVKIHPPIERILRETVEKLQRAGHEIVSWDSSSHHTCIEIMDEYYTADGGEDIRTAIEQGGEPYIPHVEALVNRGSPISVFQYWELNRRKVAAQKAYYDMWNSIKSPSGRTVDVVLMPTMPHAAVRHRACRWVGYTKVFNLLDYSAISFPAGKVDKSVDVRSSSDYIPRNEYDEWNWKQYDPDLMDGCPIGLQIVGRRFEEEKILGIAKQFENLLRS